MRTLTLVLAAAFASFAQQPQATGSAPATITVAAGQQWTDTGLDLAAGESIHIEATGTISYLGKESGPDGIARGWMDLIRAFPLNEAKRGALLGRIGESNAAQPFLIGPRTDREVPIAGRLFLGVNQSPTDRATGAFTVVLTRRAGSSANHAENLDELRKAIVPVTKEQLNSVPRRVSGADGTPGDRTNFLIVGSEKNMLESFEKAGWVRVDKSVKDTIFRGILVSLSKQAYVTLPMSELMLYGRGQDYGWAQGDPVQVIAARHHFRIWKAPFTAGGRTVWAGAGTHDVGFDRDQRNGKLTHKIDPDTDKERDYIGNSLAAAGATLKLDYLTPKDPITKANTAHGQAFFSDGRSLIIYLKPDVSDVSESFTDTFCTVLANNPGGEKWGGCSDYIETEKAPNSNAALPPLSKDYRVLIVPGFMSSCFSDSPAFNEALPILREKYGIDVHYLQVPNDASTQNARMIADYLKENSKTDFRKWILVGYSKGTPDLQETLAANPSLRYITAAFISVAGASGGSHIADAIPGIADQYINRYKIKETCKGDAALGFKSLSKAVRSAFLASYPNPFVPTYSIIASSNKNNTSKALLQTWQLLTTYDPLQDGQLTRADAVIPGSTYLGVAKGDHFAVALPFDKSEDAQIKAGMDKTRYPRAALLESLLRFVTADLEKKQTPGR